MIGIRSALKREIDQSLNSRFGRNASWLIVGQFTSFLLQALYFILLARLLERNDYGVYAGAFAFSSLVAQYSPVGTGTVLLRRVSQDETSFSVNWGTVLVITSVLGSIISVALYFAGNHILNPSSAALVLPASIANCVFAQLTLETSRVFQAFEKMKFSALMALLTSLARAVTACAMLIAWHHATAWQWAIASMIISAAGALTAVGVVTFHFGWPRFDGRFLLPACTEGFGYSFAASTSSIYNDIDKTMLSHYGMNAANGIYTMAYRVIDIASMPILSIRDAALPRLFKSGAADLAATSHLAIRLLRRAFPFALAAAAGIFVVAPLVPFLVGNGFAQAVIALRWLCFIPIFRSIHQMAGAALTGAGLQSHRTAAQFSAAMLNVGLNLHWIPMYGWRGAAWASLITDATLAALTMLLFKIKIINRRNILGTHKLEADKIPS